MLHSDSPIAPFYLHGWSKFTDFCNVLNQDSFMKLFFDGEGLINVSNSEQLEKHYLFSINNQLYSTVLVKENNDNSSYNFLGVIALDLSVLQNSIIKSNGNYFKKFEASIDIDCKPYDYGHEHKLLISKATKVDLLFSQQLNKENESFVLKVQTYPSLKQAIDWQKKVNNVNERTAKIIAEKKLLKKS